MQTVTVVALDAMGGDNAPAEIVRGAVDAVSSVGISRYCSWDRRMS